MPQQKGKKTEVVSISMPMQLREAVTKYADSQDTSVSDVVNGAVKNYLLLKEWDEIRKIMRPAALRLGIETDEDVEYYFK